MSSFEWSSILGKKKLVLRNNVSQRVDDLGFVKVVGLYFSAHWCPPCRSFTPKLAKFYEKISKEGMVERPMPLEIVFVSSDRDKRSFDKYLSQMPWSAVDFSARDIKDKLAAKFGVRGIPCLVLLDAQTGELLTKNGRKLVTLYGSDFARKALDKEVLKKVNSPVNFFTSRMVVLLIIAVMFALVYNGTISINI